jgi:ADP-ribosylglycohydrolase
MTSRLLTRSKVQGMLIGGAIGDAIGAPVETWTPAKIIEVHGGPLVGYVEAIGHKWFKPEEFLRGMTTDDTQLTVATMRGLIDAQIRNDSITNWDEYLDAIALGHVEASHRTIGGWGKTTTEAVKRLKEGISWRESGKTDNQHRGTGNGVPMKCSPLAAWLASSVGQEFEDDDDQTFSFNRRVVDYSAMTHYTKISAHAGVAHCALLSMCLTAESGGIDADYVHELLNDHVPNECHNAKDADDLCYKVEHLDDGEHNIFDRFATLKRRQLIKMTIDEVRAMYGNGSCYVYDSVPFAYAVWLRNLGSIEGILEAANAGGDTDTNAKIVGELLGATEGIEFFTEEENLWALQGLYDPEKLIDIANEFCDTFDIE